MSGRFPRDRIPKTTKDVNVRLFIHSRNLCKFYQRIAGRFEATNLCSPLYACMVWTGINVLFYGSLFRWGKAVGVWSW